MSEAMTEESMGTRHYVLTAALLLASASANAATYGELGDMRGQPLPGVPAQAWNAGVYAPAAPVQPNCCKPAVVPYPGYAGGPQMMPGYAMGGGYPGAAGYPLGPSLGLLPGAGRWPTALPYLPVAANGLPAGRQVRWTYGQVNASSDPFNVWGLSTPHMFVPWSTPMSGWTNAQTWDWWRNRAGDPGPALPLW
jgi:hypothetical protein